MRALTSAFAFFVFAFLAVAQAQDPRGYRGRWNDWAYEPMVLAQGAWRITMQAVARKGVGGEVDDRHHLRA